MSAGPTKAEWLSLRQKMMPGNLAHIGFSAHVDLVPLEGGEVKSVQARKSSYCREVLIRDFKDFLSSKCTTHHRDPNGWNREAVQQYSPKFSATPALLHYSGTSFSPALVRTLNVMVGLPALLLSPERDEGEFWITTPEYARKGCYTGVDGSFLFSPALVSIIMGLFRQAVKMDRLGITAGLLKEVGSRRVQQALRSKNTTLALELFTKAKPWVCPPMASGSFPLDNKRWPLFPKLHQAIYSKGLEGVFGKPDKIWRVKETYRGGITRGVADYLTKKRVAQIQKMAKSAE